jgi:SAM-dependent methyltransferase
VFRDGAANPGAVVRADQPWADAQLARLYDAFLFQADLPFYRNLGHAAGGRVLEVACGSGRVLVDLVEHGCHVVGVDISPPMLALAREKLDARPRLTGTAHLVHADMRTFRLAEEMCPFDLAIVAVKSFAYLIELADQLQCLQTIALHLRPGGLLALDLLHPRPEWVGAESGSMRDDLVQHVPERGFTLARVESVIGTDVARQVRVIRSAYEVVDDEGRVVTKRYVEWPYRYMYRFEVEHLLARAGFRVEALHGGYAGEPFTSESRTMLFVASLR